MKVGLTKVQFTRASLVFVNHGKYDADPAPEWLMDFDGKTGLLVFAARANALMRLLKT